jgi:sulfonate transport system ATP-binding protein
MNMLSPLADAAIPPLTSTGVAVVVRGLTRAFNGQTVLNNLSFGIAQGEFVALLGRSGSGKSTLLRTLAGLDAAPPETLSVPPARAVVFQEPRLLPWKRVWRNVSLGLRRADAKTPALAALDEVELGHRRNAWPLTLSGGEAQRVALARALVREPQPLWLTHRPAVLLVTHDVDEALLLADRVMVLKDGVIAVDQPVSLERPRRHADPQFDHLRTALLAALGVH